MRLRNAGIGLIALAALAGCGGNSYGTGTGGYTAPALKLSHPNPIISRMAQTVSQRGRIRVALKNIVYGAFDK